MATIQWPEHPEQGSPEAEAVVRLEAWLTFAQTVMQDLRDDVDALVAADEGLSARITAVQGSLKTVDARLADVDVATQGEFDLAVQDNAVAQTRLTVIV